MRLWFLFLPECQFSEIIKGIFRLFYLLFNSFFFWGGGRGGGCLVVASGIFRVLFVMCMTAVTICEVCQTKRIPGKWLVKTTTSGDVTFSLKLKVFLLLFLKVKK